MSKDIIYREDAIKAINQVGWLEDSEYESRILAIPSADRPTVIRVKSIMKKEDYESLAESIRQQDQNVIVIPHNAELVTTAGRPQGEWIPCSERLPQIGQKVLASTKKTVFTQVFKGYYSEPKRWAWENNSVKTIEAWMPLPKPWKGADDEVR